VEVISVEEHLGINADEHRPECYWPKQRELPLENMADADGELESAALAVASQRSVADVASLRLVSEATIVRWEVTATTESWALCPRSAKSWLRNQSVLVIAEKDDMPSHLSDWFPNPVAVTLERRISLQH
jgi:hypothetical protein